MLLNVLTALLQRELNKCTRSDFAIEKAAAFGLTNVTAEGDDFGFDEKSVSWSDGFTPFHFICRHEIADFPLVFRNAKDEDTSGLGHGFELKNARHDGLTWKVSLEELFVEAHVLNRSACLVGEINDPIDKQEGIAMGKDVKDVG